MAKNQKKDSKPVIKLIVTDSFGAGVLNAMIAREIDRIECIVVSTDYEVLMCSNAGTKILIGFGPSNEDETCYPEEIDRYAYQKIQQSLKETDIVIIVSYLSGRETNSVAMIAAAARATGAQTIGVILVRAIKEDRKLIPQLNVSAQRICQQLDSLLVLSPNLLDRSLATPASGMLDRCKLMDVQVVDAVSGFIKLISKRANETSALTYQGIAAMGIGTAFGANRAAEAAARATSSPLLVGRDVSRAQGAVVVARSSDEITPDDIQAMRRQVSGKIQTGATVITEMMVDEKSGKELRVSALFTGVGKKHETVLYEPYLEFDTGFHSGWDHLCEQSQADTYFDIFGKEDPSLREDFLDMIDYVLSIDTMPRGINLPLLPGLVAILRQLVKEGLDERSAVTIFLHLLAGSAARFRLSEQALCAINEAYGNLDLGRHDVRSIEDRMKTRILENPSIRDRFAVRSILSDDKDCRSPERPVSCAHLRRGQT